MSVSKTSGFIALSLARITAHTPREEHDAVTNHGDRRHFEQSKPDHGRELVVPRDLVDGAVKK
jgi:hypothetical protein